MVRPSRLRSLAGYLAASASGIVDDFPGFIQDVPTRTKTLIAGRWRRAEAWWDLLSQNRNQKRGNIMKRREFLKTAGAGLAVSTAVAAPAIA
jgi:hypothetical protein